MSMVKLGKKAIQAQALHDNGAVEYPERETRDAYAVYLIRHSSSKRTMSYAEFRAQYESSSTKSTKEIYSD
jgi:hypothetical protein